MVTTVLPPGDYRNRASAGEGFDGVVRVSSGGYYGTGVLLYGGQAVLTAAHTFRHGDASTTVRFETTTGIQTINASKVTKYSAYDVVSNNGDLAIIWLGQSAPVGAERYTLYRQADELYQNFTLVGYGSTGTGLLGTSSDGNKAAVRLQAHNRFDADAATLKAVIDTNMSWSPQQGTVLLADFDNGLHANDALGQLIGLLNTGLGVDEGLMAPGDSGGPAFINGQIAGIASYTLNSSKFGVSPDIDLANNSSYGEIGAWQRVSAYQQWIDQSLRAAYPDAPSNPSEVKTSVQEGNASTSYAYFMLNFTGIRKTADEVLSVDFTTRDGTAMAGADYLPTHGTLKLYPGETQALIPVEIIGDTTAEVDEFFYLDVSNPVGGSFGEGIVTLTAVRTIVNDDVFLMA